MELTFLSHSTVELIDFMGGDSRVVEAARVSTKGQKAAEGSEGVGLVKFLLREKHWSPFQHSVFTFRVHTPIFVTRQLLRHTSSSFSEESGRYRELEPVFYVPGPDRPVVQVGKTGDYNFVDDAKVSKRSRFHIKWSSRLNWWAYRAMLKVGTSKEVARMVLPTNIYSSMYITVNARNLMHMIAVRNDHHAQAETREVAAKMEEILADKMPVTHAAFRES